MMAVVRGPRDDRALRAQLKKVALSGGDGSGDSSSIIKGGGTDLSRQHGQVKRGDIDPQRKSINLQAAKDEMRRREQARGDAAPMAQTHQRC